MVNTVSNVLSVLTIVVDVVLVLALFDLWYYRGGFSNGSWILRFLKKYALETVFVFSFVAMIGSLFYSEVAGYAPCTLCWYQRIFMYSLVFMSAGALYWRDAMFLRYSWIASVVGAILAAYHYLLQIGVITFSTCSAVGYSITCSEHFVLRYGYITIPMMALSVFLMIAIASYLSYPRKERVKE